MTSINEHMTIGEARALAAERMLERKRIGLESAIEALETVGYLVQKDEQGKFKVTQPFSVLDELGGGVSYGDNGKGFLGDYPEVLTVKDAAAILGVSCRTVSRLCASNQLPSFKVGNSIRISKRALVEAMSRQAG